MGLIPTGSIKCTILAKEYLGSLLAKGYMGSLLAKGDLGLFWLKGTWAHC